MILRDLLQLVLFIGLLAALSPLLGRYVHQVFSGRRTFLHPVLGPVERGVYSLSGIHPDENQTWSRYAVSLIGFSLAGISLQSQADMTMGVVAFPTISLICRTVSISSMPGVSQSIRIMP